MDGFLTFFLCNSRVILGMAVAKLVGRVTTILRTLLPMDIDPCLLDYEHLHQLYGLGSGEVLELGPGHVE
jgi:hypothetical protein